MEVKRCCKAPSQTDSFLITLVLILRHVRKGVLSLVLAQHTSSRELASCSGPPLRFCIFLLVRRVVPSAGADLAVRAGPPEINTKEFIGRKGTLGEGVNVLPLDQWLLLECHFGLPLFDANLNDEISRRVVANNLFASKRSVSRDAH